MKTTTTTISTTTLTKNKESNNLLGKLITSYNEKTSQQLKLIDIYLMFIMLTGILQFIYVLLAGTFPYNAFLAGFISTVGSFVFAVNLRIQTNPKNVEFNSISPVRAFADFLFCNILLQFFVANFLG